MNAILDVDLDCQGRLPILLFFEGFKHPIPFHTNGSDGRVLLPFPGHLVNVAGGKEIAMLVFEWHVKERSWEQGAKMALGCMEIVTDQDYGRKQHFMGHGHI